MLNITLAEVMIEWMNFPDNRTKSAATNRVLEPVMFAHLVVAMLVSVSLNPFLAKYYYDSNKKHSTVKILFCLIALTDLLTNGLLPAYLLYFVANEGRFTVYGQYNYKGPHAIKHHYFLVGLFFICFYGCISQV